MKDAKATIELQPHFLKAFVRGKSSNSARNQVDEESLGGCATSKSLLIYFILFYSIFFFHLFKSYAPINVKPAGEGGQGMGWDLIVFVVPGVEHLTDLVLPGEGIFESFFARRGDI